MKRYFTRIWIALIAALLLSGLVTGCQYGTRFREMVRPLSLSFAVTYVDGGSEMVVRYSIPPPPTGKVYVLWAYNQGRSQVAKLGEVAPGVDRVARGSANFRVQGVIITTENSGNVARMEGTGVIELTLNEESTRPPGSQGTPQPTPRRQ